MCPLVDYITGSFAISFPKQEPGNDGFTCVLHEHS
jgi:hypothetical protein